MRVGAKLQNFMEQSSKGCTNNGVKHPDIPERMDDGWKIVESLTGTERKTW